MSKYCLGLDIGYSNLKMVMGEVGGRPKEIILPAGAGPASKMPTSMSFGEDNPAIHVLLDDEAWAAGVPANYLENWERDLHADYPKTNNYRALFYAALLRTGRDVIDTLVTGLPVDQYLQFERRDSLAEALCGHHRVSAKRSVEVKRVEVLPQPVGAYMHLVSTSEPDLIEVMEEGLVVVLDPGYFSVDWVAMQGGTLRKGSSGTSTKAMSVVLEEAARLVIEDRGDGACTKEKIENALRSNKDYVLAFGDRVLISEYVSRAIATVAPQAMTLMRQSMRGDVQGADVVLLTGGGGGAYADAARELFPKSRVVVPKNPVLANAQGFYFYGS